MARVVLLILMIGISLLIYACTAPACHTAVRCEYKPNRGGNGANDFCVPRIECRSDM